MARTLIKTQAIGAYSDYYLKLYIEETVNVSANTSSVTVSLYGYTERAAAICSFNNEGTNSISVVIDGTTNTLNNLNIDTSDWRTEHLLHSYTKTVNHNSDGTKTISVSGSLNYKGGGTSLVAGTYSTGSVSQTLTPIARASKVGTVSGTNINSTSGNVTINVTKANNAYYDRIVTTGAISKTIDVGQGTSGTIPWTDVLDSMTSSASATLNITVRTYSDSSYSTLVGSNTGSATIKISTSAIKPSVSWGAISANSGGLSSNLVAGKSTAKATWTVTNARGASVASVAITATNCSIASGASSTSTTGTPVTATLPANSSANYTIKLTATVTDSRGATATASTATKTVYLYKKPIVTLNAYRTATNSSTAEDPAGAYVYVTYSASVGASVNGSNSISSTTTSPSGVTSGSWRSVSTTSTWSVSVTATDAAGGSTTVSRQIATAKVPLDLYSNAAGTSVGVGIGGAASADRFNVGLPTYHNDDVFFPSGKGVYLSGNTTTPIGTVKTATSSVTSLSNNSTTNIVSVTLTKGVWVVSGQFSMPVASSDSFRLITSITTTSGDYGYTAAYNNQACVGSAQTVVAVSPTRILEVTAASQTVYLTANQNSGGSKTLTASRNVIRAVCVA